MIIFDPNNLIPLHRPLLKLTKMITRYGSFMPSICIMDHPCPRFAPRGKFFFFHPSPLYSTFFKTWPKRKIGSGTIVPALGLPSPAITELVASPKSNENTDDACAKKNHGCISEVCKFSKGYKTKYICGWIYKILI